MKTKFFSLLISSLALAAAGGGASVAAQSVADHGAVAGGAGAAHLVMEYKSDPRRMVNFRRYMQTKALPRFRQWQAQGLVTGFRILVADHTIKTLPDMYVMLDFAHFADIEQWQKVEKTMPGGLDAEGLALAEPTSTTYSDVPWSSHAATTDHHRTIYMIIPYTVLSSMEQYSDYVDKYVTAQTNAWVRTGILADYDIHLNQNPVEATWDSLAVFEYRDMAALAMRDAVKQRVRGEIKDLPGYKEYAPIKGKIRSEHLAALYEDIAQR